MFGASGLASGPSTAPLCMPKLLCCCKEDHRRERAASPAAHQSGGWGARLGTQSRMEADNLEAKEILWAKATQGGKEQKAHHPWSAR